MICRTREMPHWVICAAVASVLLAWTQPACAHGVGWQADGSFGVAVQFQYDDGEPMPFGSVLIYSPATDEYEYQGGRSDENGYFSFRPNVPGTWKFVGDDGQGHVTRGEILVTEADLSGKPAENATTRPIVQGGARKPGAPRIFLGLSILLNIALASLWRQAKRGRAPAPDTDKEQG